MLCSLVLNILILYSKLREIVVIYQVVFFVLFFQQLSNRVSPTNIIGHLTPLPSGLPHSREITLSIPRGKQRGALSERGSHWEN